MTPPIPTAAIIGVPRAGTTFLWSLLRQHPEIVMPERKESHYFSLPELQAHVGGPGDAHIVPQLHHNEEEYRHLFGGKTGQDFCSIDVSPSYFFYPKSIERLLMFNPDVRCVLLLRNPTEKAYSHYKMRKKQGRETLSFEQALDCEADRKEKMYNDFWLYQESGLYLNKLKEIHRILPEGRLKVIFFDELTRNPQEVIDALCIYLEIPGIDIGRAREKMIKNDVTNDRFPVLKSIKHRLGKSPALRDLLTRFGIKKMYENVFTEEFPALNPTTKNRLDAFFSTDYQGTLSYITQNNLGLLKGGFANPPT